jgi:Lytic transglycolase
MLKILSLVVLFFASPGFCQSFDSAPDNPPPVQHVKDAVPKWEPLSRFGNAPFYTVGGKTYDLTTSVHGFKQRGIASWYGTKFHQQKTSSGETYDMYAMTAAHKTLPIPSYARVTNLKNGKQIVVRDQTRHYRLWYGNGRTRSPATERRPITFWPCIQNRKCEIVCPNWCLHFGTQCKKIRDKNHLVTPSTCCDSSQ